MLHIDTIQRIANRVSSMPFFSIFAVNYVVCVDFLNEKKIWYDGVNFILLLKFCIRLMTVTFGTLVSIVFV